MRIFLSIKYVEEINAILLDVTINIKFKRIPNCSSFDPLMVKQRNNEQFLLWEFFILQFSFFPTYKF